MGQPSKRAGLSQTEREIAKRDSRGRSFDVHAFRTTFNSLLAAAGVPLRTRQVLMRHATSGTLTDDVYSDAKLLDLRGALDKLPALPLHGVPNAERTQLPAPESGQVDLDKGSPAWQDATHGL